MLTPVRTHFQLDVDLLFLLAMLHPNHPRTTTALAGACRCEVRWRSSRSRGRKRDATRPTKSRYAGFYLKGKRPRPLSPRDLFSVYTLNDKFVWLIYLTRSAMEIGQIEMENGRRDEADKKQSSKAFTAKGPPRPPRRNVSAYTR